MSQQSLQSNIHPWKTKNRGGITDSCSWSAWLKPILPTHSITTRYILVGIIGAIIEIVLFAYLFRLDFGIADSNVIAFHLAFISCVGPRVVGILCGRCEASWALSRLRHLRTVAALRFSSRASTLMGLPEVRMYSPGSPGLWWLSCVIESAFELRFDVFGESFQSFLANQVAPESGYIIYRDATYRKEFI